MTRAQTLGLMAAYLWARPDLRMYENPGDCVREADALLREAERVSPPDAPCEHEWAGFGLGPDPKLVCNKCGEVAAEA